MTSPLVLENASPDRDEMSVTRNQLKHPSPVGTTCKKVWVGIDFPVMNYCFKNECIKCSLITSLSNRYSLKSPNKCSFRR